MIRDFNKINQVFEQPKQRIFKHQRQNIYQASIYQASIYKASIYQASIYQASVVTFNPLISLQS